MEIEFLKWSDKDKINELNFNNKKDVFDLIENYFGKGTNQCKYYEKSYGEIMDFEATINNLESKSEAKKRECAK